ncbi:hypothetical protein GUJ93_ZPchr0014g47124 [Zizania palustris]|uniref:Secreted protein n=1 Tax=Zizania palustris TaxID=103762 RepID=A0A8J5SW52_ZIZPA|nr:hypothetical protein GUJ93_ZPchr0014g47124 [Zizania palustris]
MPVALVAPRALDLVVSTLAAPLAPPPVAAPPAPWRASVAPSSALQRAPDAPPARDDPGRAPTGHRSARAMARLGRPFVGAPARTRCAPQCGNGGFPARRRLPGHDGYPASRT